MSALKTNHENFKCPVINKTVIIGLTEIVHNNQVLKEAIMTDCNSYRECGVVNKKGNVDWSACPVYEKTKAQIMAEHLQG